jgi:hypothetical protein
LELSPWFPDDSERLSLVGCSGSNCYGGVIGSEEVRFTALLLADMEIKLEQLDRSINDSELLERIGGDWAMDDSHLMNKILEGLAELFCPWRGRAARVRSQLCQKVV